MEFEVVRNPLRDSDSSDILNQVFNLRFKVYRDIRLVDPLNYPEEIFVDDWDFLSGELHGTLHYVGIEAGSVRGATRIVPFTSDNRWSLQGDFDFDEYLRGEHGRGLTLDDHLPMADGSRIITENMIEGGKPFHRGAIDLLYISHKDALDRGNKYVFTNANPDFSGFLAIGYTPVTEAIKHIHDVNSQRPDYPLADHFRSQTMRIDQETIRHHRSQERKLTVNRTYGVIEVKTPEILEFSDILVKEPNPEKVDGKSPVIRTK